MVKITIELNDTDVERIIDEMEEDECNCECEECSSECEEGYTKKQMIDANLDELHWYIKFVNKYYDTFKHHPAMLDEINDRILFGQKIVKDLMEME